MRIIPRSIASQLEFHRLHAPIFAANAHELGLSQVQAADYVASTQTLDAAVERVRKLEAEYRSAIVAQDAAVAQTRSLASGLVQLITVRARVEKNVQLYVLASLPVPSAGGPIHPINPSNVTIALRTNGQIELAWDGSSAHGTQFIIRRCIEIDGQPPTDAVYIGHSGTKSFVDTTVPPGTVKATYTIIATKGDQATLGSTPATMYFTPNCRARTANVASLRVA